MTLANFRQQQKEHPEIFLYSSDEGEMLKTAYNALFEVLSRYSQTDAPETVQMQAESRREKIKGEALAEFERLGLSLLRLKTLCKRVKTKKYWTYGMIGPDKTGHEVYECISNVKRYNLKVTYEKFPAFYSENATVGEQANAIGIPANYLFIIPAENGFAYEISAIFEERQSTPEETGQIMPFVDYKMWPFPNNQGISLFNRVMVRAGKPVAITGSREKIKATQNKATNEVTIISTRQTSESKIRVKDLQELLHPEGTGKGKRSNVFLFDSQKLILYLVIKTTHEMSKQKSLPAEVLIDLKDISGPGKPYANLATARRGFDTAWARMLLFEFENEETGKVGPLFQGRDKWKPRHSTTNIVPNNLLGYNWFMNCTADIPYWVFSLRETAFNLAFAIFSYIRMNGAKLSKQGYFTIKGLTISQRLGQKSLADVMENHGQKVGRYIRQPILDAIKEVNEAAATATDINGTLKIEAPNAKDIESWLDAPFKVYANGEYCRGAITVSNQKAKIRKKALPESTKT